MFIDIRLRYFGNMKLKLEIETRKNSRGIRKFYARYIVLDEDLIVREDDFMDFIELLNSFTSGILDIDQKYDLVQEVFGKKIEGYYADFVTKNKHKYIRLKTVNSGKEIFLSKYDCRVIVGNFKKAYSMCMRSEFVFNDN